MRHISFFLCVLFSLLFISIFVLNIQRNKDSKFIKNQLFCKLTDRVNEQRKLINYFKIIHNSEFELRN